MPTMVGRLARYPARTSVSWYLGILLLGTVLLALMPCSARSDAPISWLDACFTATSALCVTGLSVRSTVHDFSFWGQVVILVLIQCGGVGIMTLTTFVMSQLGARADLRQQALMEETLGATSRTNLRWIVARVLLLALGFELLGTCLLLPKFLTLYAWPQACWYSLFHSVSAFCNAGFALYDDSMVTFQHDWWMNSILMLLIVVGGIGFPVLMDLARCYRRQWLGGWEDLRLHSKLTLLTTALLIAFGTTAFLLLESNGLLKDLPWSQRLLTSLFHSVSCRTAGFNSVSLPDLTNASLFVMIMLMVVGAGACSTAGGIKVSTVAMLLLHAFSRFRGEKQIHVFRRTVPTGAVDRAMATAMLFLVVAAIALTLLLFTDQSDLTRVRAGGSFLDAMFEVCSALGTVGLSTGITAGLSVPGKLIIIVLMFIGRLGPISVFAALAVPRKPRPIQYASEAPLVG